jgi:hypothetical protein
LLALDQGGGLYSLDPSVPPDKIRSCWRYIAPALAENPLMTPRLLRAADGHSAYEVAAPGDGKSLIVRHIQWAGDERKLQVNEQPVSLMAQTGNNVLTPAGAPIVLGSQLLIPMNDGTIGRLLPGQNKLQSGFSWRARGAPANAVCHLLALSSDRFLLTDGSRGMTVYEWRLNDEWQPLPKDREPLVPLEHLLAAPPVLVPNAAGQHPGVIVADSAGRLTVFIVQPDGSLKAASTPPWELEGNLSAGPFVQATPEGGWRIGCILDRRRLVWLDPAKEKPLWIYDTEGPAIIGQPQRIDDMLVVALQSGRYVGIDPLTGKPKGLGYTLRTSAAPAVPPMPFGPGQMFAPLTDGSALLLALDRLREPAKK